MEKKDILIIISLFLISFLIRVVGVSYSSLYIDEWIYMLKTRLILSNDWFPIAMVFDRSPPFFSHIGAAVTVLFGGGLNTIRMIAVVFGSLNVSALYLFGKVVYDRKVGLLSALFLLISPYHILYSRVYMLETVTLFFIITFLYFFWLSQISGDRKAITYAIISGALLGLAFDAKYISIFLIPSVLTYILWTNRFKFKELLNKKIISIFIFAFLFFLPLLICLIYTDVWFHGMAYFAYERFDSGSVTRNTVAAPYMFSLDEIIVKGVEKVIDVYAWGNEAGAFIPPWSHFFKITAFLLLSITTILCIWSLIKRDEKKSFFMISILMLIILIFVSGNTRHYWIYSFPFYYVMFSHLAVESFEHLKKKGTYKKIFGTIFILLTALMLLFCFISTVTSPSWDRGDYHPWAKNVVKYIERDITRCGYDEEVVLIGNVMTINKMISYELYIGEKNISTIVLLEKGRKYSGALTTLNPERIKQFKPTYIIVPETFYEIHFTDDVKNEIFEDYRIVFHSQDYPTGCFVLKRKNIQLSELKIPTDSKSGKISSDLFKRSVPSMMTVGKVHNAQVQIKNTGDSRRDFTIRVDTEDFVIFVEENQRIVTLDKDSIRRIEFKMVPIEEYVGELPITVDLYVEFEDNGVHIIKKVDSVSDYVSHITL